MASILFQKDKRSGITYAYESVSYWDKEKQQSRAKRTLIGRVDEKTGVVPTDGRNRKKKDEENPAKPGPVPAAQTARTFYGATYLFDGIGQKPHYRVGGASTKSFGPMTSRPSPVIRKAFVRFSGATTKKMTN